METLMDQGKEKSLKTLTLIIYVLQALTYFTAITGVIGVIINYVKREEVRGTWLDTHFTWQIRTFWWSVVWGVIAWIFAVTIIGLTVAWPIWFAIGIWGIYRVIRGVLNLNDNKPMPL